MGKTTRFMSLANASILLLALSFLPVANADCFIDDFGRERCTLSTGARIGIAVASVVAFIAVIACLGLARRRRIRRANMAYITTQQPAYTGYGQPYGNSYPYGSAPAYEGNNGYIGYPPQPYATGGGYAPPPGPPPGGAQSPPQHYDGTPYSPPKEPPPARV